MEHSIGRVLRLIRNAILVSPLCLRPFTRPRILLIRLFFSSKYRERLRWERSTVKGCRPSSRDFLLIIIVLISLGLSVRFKFSRIRNISSDINVAFISLRCPRIKRLKCFWTIYTCDCAISRCLSLHFDSGPLRKFRRPTLKLLCNAYLSYSYIIFIIIIIHVTSLFYDQSREKMTSALILYLLSTRGLRCSFKPV